MKQSRNFDLRLKNDRFYEKQSDNITVCPTYDFVAQRFALYRKVSQHTTLFNNKNLVFRLTIFFFFQNNSRTKAVRGLKLRTIRASLAQQRKELFIEQSRMSTYDSVRYR